MNPYLELFFFGKPLRLVDANSFSCFSLMDEAICFEAPFSEDFGRSPRFAESAAPAAICCFFDFAGILVGSPETRAAVASKPARQTG